MDTFVKQPADKLDYVVDLSDWLTDNDNIVDASTVVESGINVLLTEIDPSTTMVKVWIDGGTDGETYKVTVTVQTQLGRRKEVDFNVRVKET